MECLYLPELNSDSENITICDDEFRHLKALHARQGEELLATNGSGIIATLSITQIEKRNAVAQVVSYTDKSNAERHIKGLALGILDNKDRFEFAVEKAVELGISDFYPLLCEYSQRKQVNAERIISKSIAAMKQSKQYFLPIIHKPISIENLILSSQSSILYADMDTESTMIINNCDSIIVIGPEGGFSDYENKLLNSAENCIGFTLGQFRLRAETAAITSLGVYNFLYNK